MRLHEPDQPVHILLKQNHHADFDWLAESQPHHHFIPPSRTFLTEAKNAQPQINDPMALQPQYDPQHLNAEQRLVYDHVEVHSNRIDAEPMSIMELGTAGTGKSYLIHCLRRLLGATVRVLAPTGVAAVNIGGATLHSSLFFPNVNTFAHLRGSSLQKLQDNFNGIKYIIIDEVSMIGCNTLNAINKRLQQAFPDSADQVFGGCSVMLFGDLDQLPQGASRLFHSNIVNPNAVLVLVLGEPQ